ncbi:hypothetical protein GCM10009801_15470 [Streptomyces albiaxialis]|uniref:Uncharacterized protein n=1 Tax=Streptomyces albiaxialis TaxID=329523 RepID=A0ABP5H7R9_9ACTN
MSSVSLPAAVERLLARPGARVEDLRTASPPPEDPDAADARADEEEMYAECEALVAALARAWGEPGILDLAPFLERTVSGEPVPEPLTGLCGHVAELAVWPVGGRWFGLGVVPYGDMFPARLVAVLGAEGPPPLSPPDAPGGARDGR